MDDLQLFFLGVMVAWTPSLVLLAWILWRDIGSQEQQSDVHR